MKCLRAGHLIEIERDGARRTLTYDPPVTLAAGEKLENDYESMTYRVVEGDPGVIVFPGLESLSSIETHY